MQWFHERSSQDLPNSKELSLTVTLGFLIGLQELLQAPLCFLRSYCFARIRLDPLGGQVLHHDCISVIVSKFAIVTEDLVICCYQVTKIFSTRYGSFVIRSWRSHWRDVTSIGSSLSRVLVSLTVGDEDELEEDVEQWLSCLESVHVHELDGSDPEDELADKPGTTIGNEVSHYYIVSESRF